MTTRPPCILGIAVSDKRLGYCVLEPQGFLLDWGVKDFPNRKIKTIEKLLAHLFIFYRPKLLILEDVAHKTCRLSNQNTQMIKKIEKLATIRLIIVQALSWSETKVHLCSNKAPNSVNAAKAVGSTYPVLRDRMPPARKTWQGEHRNMVLLKASAFVSISTRLRLVYCEDIRNHIKTFCL